MIEAMAKSEEGSPLASRRRGPVRLFRLGDEPPDDQSGMNTPEERLAMMWDLSREAWSLTGQPLPGYLRHETPVTCRPWRVAGSARG
jgi:hypothetical protein